MKSLSSGYQSLNASQPWFCLWILNTAYHLNAQISPEERTKFLVKIASLQNETGGFAGTPTFSTVITPDNKKVSESNPYNFLKLDQAMCGEQSHLLSSFAAVCSLVLLGGKEAANLTNRSTMLNWLLQMKQNNGSFTVHFNGEVDLRGSYCAIVIAFLLDIMTPEIVSNVADFVYSCQNYDGGFGPSPGVESHGSYSFCAIAILDILDRFDCIDMAAFLDYVTKRQMPLEGGFNGRINKLVDGCYSYWIGSIFPMIQSKLDTTSFNSFNYSKLGGDSSSSLNKDLAETQSSDDNNDPGLNYQPDLLFDRMMLQKYILLCCQAHPILKAGDRGNNKRSACGLRDKPGTFPDYYHTSYCLSGLSVSQHYLVQQKDAAVPELDDILLRPNVGCAYCKLVNSSSQHSSKRSAAKCIPKSSKVSDACRCGCCGKRKVARLAKINSYVANEKRKLLVFGEISDNQVMPVHPVYNLGVDKISEFFSFQ
ncbi:Protein farnesyltransferase subunit beta [Smittium culicis]|uniref:Protein farnesyltransferase subunit beta n=1 Tax=Smittium culicis TaxID=133412 RepID=A0A1R1X512_9FUNG|nr:Protein farnesyltransferase subunit beta [Smittium culicis]